MPFIKTEIEGLLVFEPRVFHDSRGYFFESYNQNTFKEAGICSHFVQDNRSLSQKGVLRGLHYQLNPMAQAKLVSVLQGSVYDVVVDIRKKSPTYGQTFGILLSAENKKQLYIPRGFAHGFVVLEDNTEFFYKCDNFYSKEHEAGIRFDDKKLQIDWQIDVSNATVSEKDEQLPDFDQAINNFE